MSKRTAKWGAGEKENSRQMKKPGKEERAEDKAVYPAMLCEAQYETLGKQWKEDTGLRRVMCSEAILIGRKMYRERVFMSLRVLMCIVSRHSHAIIWWYIQRFLKFILKISALSLTEGEWLSSWKSWCKFSQISICKLGLFARKSWLFYFNT